MVILSISDIMLIDIKIIIDQDGSRVTTTEHSVYFNANNDIRLLSVHNFIMNEIICFIPLLSSGKVKMEYFYDEILTDAFEFDSVVELTADEHLFKKLPGMYTVLYGEGEAEHLNILVEVLIEL